MTKIARVYHPYWEWEEVDAGMWSTVQNPDKYLRMAIQFTGDHKKYGRWMMKVVREWVKSCENALTDRSLNRKASLGHAACAMAIGCPEDITRKAWGYLSDEQRILANREAERAISWWEYNYRKGERISGDVGIKVLL